MSGNELDLLKETYKKSKGYRKYHEHLIRAIRYHFSQFNLWVAFFITINGGLLVAYYNIVNNIDENKLLIKFILILGYIASLSFYSISIVYKLCINHFSNTINKFEESNNEYSYHNKEKIPYRYSLEFTKKATIIIVFTFSFILTYAWTSLLSSLVYNYTKYYSLICFLSIGYIINSFLLLLGCLCFRWIFKIEVTEKT